MSTFDLDYRIRVLDSCANNDYYYGPYSSIDAAKQELADFLEPDIQDLVIGRTIGVLEDGVIKEYWWQYIPAEGDQPAKYDFVLKTPATANDSSASTDIETITEPQIDGLFGDAYVEEMLKDLVPVFKDEFGTTEPTEPTEPTE
jgi:hypothetical protein